MPSLAVSNEWGQDATVFMLRGWHRATDARRDEQSDEERSGTERREDEDKDEEAVDDCDGDGGKVLLSKIAVSDKEEASLFVEARFSC